MNVPKYIKRRCIGFFLCAVVALTALLGGCSDMDTQTHPDSDTDKSGLAGQYWEASSYTLDEINAKLHPVLYNYERVFKADDVSEDALHAYNVLLGYAERILGQEYYVYDYYYADWGELPFAWLIKIVPYEMARTAEEEERNYLYVDEPLSMFYYEDGSEVASTIEPYYMARKWYSDLEREMAESFPDYQLELRISELDNIYPDVLKERFTDISDYTYIINENFYDRSDEWEYGNIIDVMIPIGTEQSGAAEIFGQIKPILTDYCVTKVNIYTLTADDDADWVDSFTIP